MAIAAEYWSLSIRFERQFSDGCSALRAGPVPLHHWARGSGEIVVLHLLLVFKNSDFLKTLT